MKHKHADLIHAWADGAEIEWRSKQYTSNEWYPNYSPNWDDDAEYRLKHKPDIVKRFYLDSNPLVGHRFSEAYTDNDLLNKHSCIMCTFDGETKTLKSVVVL